MKSLSNRSYLTRAIQLIDGKKQSKGQRLILDGASFYGDKMLKAIYPAPSDDLPLIAATLRHIANEIERANPHITEFTKILETTIPLPPVEFKNKP